MTKHCDLCGSAAWQIDLIKACTCDTHVHRNCLYYYTVENNLTNCPDCKEIYHSQDNITDRCYMFANRALATAFAFIALGLLFFIGIVAAYLVRTEEDTDLIFLYSFVFIGCLIYTIIQLLMWNDRPRQI